MITDAADRDGEDRLNRYRDSLAAAWFDAEVVWPIKVSGAFHLFLPDFAEEFIADLKGLRAVGYSDESIAKLFGSPSRIYRMIDSLIFGMRRLEVPRSDQKEIVHRLLSMVRCMKAGSEFNEDGRNRVLGPRLERALASRLSTRPIPVDESRLLHRFCGVIWAYVEAMYFRAHDVGKEIHGAYVCDRRFSNVLVRDYFNLRPLETWGDIPLLPCERIGICCNYAERVAFRIDAMNNLFHLGGNLVPDLVNYGVEIDGRPAKLTDLRELIECSQRAIAEISATVDRLSWNGRVQKYAEVYWLRKKPLRDARGLQWTVPAGVVDAIRAGEMDHRRAAELSDKDVRRLARLTI